jgi:hypothetical protein
MQASNPCSLRRSLTGIRAQKLASSTVLDRVAQTDDATVKN